MPSSGRVRNPRRAGMDVGAAGGKANRQMQCDLTGAIQQQELTLYYQPQFDVRSGQVCGVEALTRRFRGAGGDREAIPAQRSMWQ
jgi:predicted signal transduction protein with EAL and GGDEF domain